MPFHRSFLMVWVRIGLLSFGGPAGQIALMREEIVQRRGWVSAESFQRGLDVAMLLPGPEAQQLATWLGWRLHGVAGGLVAGLSFILPGAFIMTILAAITVMQGETAWVSAMFYGVQAAVLVIVIRAVIGLARKATSGPVGWGLAAASFAALTFTQIAFPVVVGVAGLVGLIAFPREAEPSVQSAGGGAPLRVICIGAGLMLGAGIAVRLLLPEVYFDVAQLFTTAAFVSFGGAYALLPYVAEHAVETYGWLSAPQMLNGLALGEATPGPLILVNLYAGFHAGLAGDGIGGGVLAAALTCLFTFLPSFTLIFAIAPYAEGLGRVPLARAALAGVSAAVIGIIAHLAVYLGGAAFFPIGLAAPEWPKILVFLVFFIWSLWRGVSVTLLISAGALAGIGAYLAGFA